MFPRLLSNIFYWLSVDAFPRYSLFFTSQTCRQTKLMGKRERVDNVQLLQYLFRDNYTGGQRHSSCVINCSASTFSVNIDYGWQKMTEIISNSSSDTVIEMIFKYSPVQSTKHGSIAFRWKLTSTPCLNFIPQLLSFDHLVTNWAPTISTIFTPRSINTLHDHWPYLIIFGSSEIQKGTSLWKRNNFSTFWFLPPSSFPHLHGNDMIFQMSSN